VAAVVVYLRVEVSFQIPKHLLFDLDVRHPLLTPRVAHFVRVEHLQRRVVVDVVEVLFRERQCLHAGLRQEAIRLHVPPGRRLRVDARVEEAGLAEVIELGQRIEGRV
jgi:hypothetical protein